MSYEDRWNTRPMQITKYINRLKLSEEQLKTLFSETAHLQKLLEFASDSNTRAPVSYDETKYPHAVTDPEEQLQILKDTAQYGLKNIFVDHRMLFSDKHNVALLYSYNRHAVPNWFADKYLSSPQ